MSDLPSRLHDDGLTYDEYRTHWREQKDDSITGKDPDSRKLLHYLKYNWGRQAHVHDEYTPSDDLQATLDAVDTPQTWMVLTEPWCGDSAFLLPIIAEAAAQNDAIALRILLRDDHLDVMDRYLTDGSRSIPKLVAFDDNGTEVFTWGPRPDGAQQRFEELREQYEDKEAMISDFIEYYEDGAWREADAELAHALHASVSSPTE